MCLPSRWPSSSVPDWGWSACAAGRRSGWSWRGWCPWRPSPGRCHSPARCERGTGSSRACRSSSRGKSSLLSLSASAGAFPGRSSSSQHPQLCPWGDKPSRPSRTKISLIYFCLLCVWVSGSLTFGNSEQQWGPSSCGWGFLHRHGWNVYFLWDEPVTESQRPSSGVFTGRLHVFLFSDISMFLHTHSYTTKLPRLSSAVFQVIPLNHSSLNQGILIYKTRLYFQKSTGITTKHPHFDLINNKYFGFTQGVKSENSVRYRGWMYCSNTPFPLEGASEFNLDFKTLCLTDKIVLIQKKGSGHISRSYI